MDDERQRALRALPAVGSLLDDPRLAHLRASLNPDVVTAAVRVALDEARAGIMSDERPPDGDLGDVIERRLTLLSTGGPANVLNGTGVIIQNNLGRAPVSGAAAVA